MTPPPRSCDTFAYVGPTATLFFKNSDRPSDEEHEVVYFAAASHPPEAQVQCTYISIPQAETTLSVVLSRPRWLWGCEMGANECGVVGGNEAVGSALAEEIGDEPRLLGMDLLRLALERGRTAAEAARVCAELLETHGQGGGCEEHDKSWTYENGFLFADATEAYVLESAGVHHWALERIPPGEARNISNGLSIRTNILRKSTSIDALCKARGWWDGESAFDWKACVGYAGRVAARGLDVFGREAAGAAHLRQISCDLSSGRLTADNSAGCAGAQQAVEQQMAVAEADAMVGTATTVAAAAASGGKQPHGQPAPPPPAQFATAVARELEALRKAVPAEVFE